MQTKLCISAVFLVLNKLYKDGGVKLDVEIKLCVGTVEELL